MNESEIQQLIAVWAQFCDENDVINDDGIDGTGTEEGRANAKFVLDYFQNDWKVPITKENLDKAKHIMLPHLKTFQTPQHREYAKLPSQDRREFAEWRGRAGMGLADTMQNANAILGWLNAHKLPLTDHNFQLAAGQKAVQHFLEYEYQPQPKDPRSHANTDDGTDFIVDGMMKKIIDPKTGKVIGMRSLTPGEQEAARREAEAAKNPQPSAELSSEEARWRQLANQQCDYGSHSDQAQIKAIFNDCRAQNLSWRKTYDQCAKKRQELQRRKEQAVLIR